MKKKICKNFYMNLAITSEFHKNAEAFTIQAIYAESDPGLYNYI